MCGRYILNENNEPIRCDNLIVWGEWFQNVDRSIDSTKKDGVQVSTVFLGLDHQFNDGPPLLFETLVFDGDHDGWCERSSTWDQAVETHKQVCRMVWGDEETQP